MTQYGADLGDARLGAGMTIPDLADTLATTAVAVGEIEHGVRWPTRDEAAQLGALFPVLRGRSRGDTHWPGCWRAPDHQECAADLRLQIEELLYEELVMQTRVPEPDLGRVAAQLTTDVLALVAPR